MSSAPARFAAALLAAAAVLPVAGCGSSAPSSSTVSMAKAMTDDASAEKGCNDLLGSGTDFAKSLDIAADGEEFTWRGTADTAGFTCELLAVGERQQIMAVALNTDENWMGASWGKAGDYYVLVDPDELGSFSDDQKAVIRDVAKNLQANVKA